MLIHRTGAREWTNRHETFTQPIHDLYDLGNEHSGNELDDYNNATEGIQSIIAEAIAAGRELRVLGGEWSWSKIAATDGILLNTKPLNLSFRINQFNLSPDYEKTPDDLYLAQCGVSVKELNDRLRKRGRSLKTTGASNGQTIAGAMSTGTHGAAIDVGSIPDYVVGLHIICGPSKHIWLERDSYPVVSDAFVHRLQAQLVRNDKLFNAAIVSFGCFGFIHGVMLETDPLFLYDAYRLTVPVNDKLFHIMETLDFTDAPLPCGSERPYHFQVLINQYDLHNQAHVTVMYKRPFYSAYSAPSVFVPGLGPGDDAPTFIGRIAQCIPALVPTIVNKLIAASYKPYDKTTGTHADFFTNTDTHGKVMSAAAGIPITEVKRITGLLKELNKEKGPFAGVLAYRFVKGTAATLGFTRFQPTCVIEMDGVLCEQSSSFYQAFYDLLNAENIPHTFHWGKMFTADETQIRKMYTDKAVNGWLSARHDILENDACKTVFTNALMREWGLDQFRVA